MRLLIVEDYRPLQQSLTKGLREAGFAVDTTRDGQEGLSSAHPYCPRSRLYLGSTTVMRTLRTRLIIGIIGGMLLLLTVFSLIVYCVIRRALVNQFDASLVSTARMLAASVEQDGNKIDLEFDVQQMPEFQRPDRPTYYQLWQHDGTVAARSPSLGTDDLLRLEDHLGTPVFRALQMRDGQVFDCFWRGDSSRKDAGVHCGLGLALVQRIVRALGGYTIVDVQNTEIFTIRLVLPARGEWLGIR